MRAPSRLLVWSIAAALALPALACRSRADDREDARTAARPSSAAVPPQASIAAASVPAAPADARPRIVVLGDSLTAGLGLPIAAAYPSLLQQRLKAGGLDLEVVNAGVSGDTSAGGLARLDWALQGDVRVLIVALGGNDALRGLPADQLQQNLSEIIERAQSKGIAVILAGMEAPPNYGREYTVSFRQAYRDLARRYNVTLLPFLLDKVAGNPALNQGDGIHPNPQGARIVADTVWSVLKPMIDAAAP